MKKIWHMYSLIVYQCAYYDAGLSCRCRFKNVKKKKHLLFLNEPIQRMMEPWSHICVLSKCSLPPLFILSFPSYFPSDLQLSFLLFPAWITFSSTTASTTGSVNWCWQLEFKLQLRHLTEQSSRSVSSAKRNRQPKQFHHLMRSRSWNTKHYSTVGFVCRARSSNKSHRKVALPLEQHISPRQRRCDCLSRTEIRPAPPMCSMERLYEVVYGSADIFEIKHSSGLIIFPWVKVKLTHQPTPLPTCWMTLLCLVPSTAAGWTQWHKHLHNVAQSKTIARQ